MSYKLQATKDYSLFELSPFNRDWDSTKRLEESMREQGFIPAYPLHVRRGPNGKLRIVGGHHRFLAAKKLGIAVFYVVCDDSASIPDLERPSCEWKLQDYMTAYARVGSKEHLAVKEFADRTGINTSQVASMLAGQTASSGNCNQKLKDGSYAIGNTDHAETVAHIVAGCKAMGVDFATNRLFVSALSLAVFLRTFDRELFLHRLATHGELARKQATRDGYLAMIEGVYNHGAKKNKLAISFLAKEAARQRAAVKKPYSKNGDERC